MSIPLLELKNLSVNFPSPGGILQAVRNISLTVPAASITCLVGESGCGKSLTCKAILRLEPEYAVLGGNIFFHGQDILAMPEAKLRKLRGAKISMIFQEPMTSLNPVLTVGEQTAEPLRLHLGMSQSDAAAKVIELFIQARIPEAKNRFHAYPHQLSGGMRQRVMIAMALACSPDLLLADEPTTALDTTIQGQILRTIKKESRQHGMAVLLITHDLGVVADVADYVGVMYAGMLVEYATSHKLFTRALHPYTQGLMAAQPGRAAIHLQRLVTIPGSVPSLDAMPRGCPFQTRCAKALLRCTCDVPPTFELENHKVSCWLYA